MEGHLKDLNATVQHLLDLTSPLNDGTDESYYSEEEEDEYNPTKGKPESSDEDGDEEEADEDEGMRDIPRRKSLAEWLRSRQARCLYLPVSSS